MRRGRKLQIHGAEKRKARDPNDRICRRTNSWWEEDERKDLEGWWCCKRSVRYGGRPVCNALNVITASRQDRFSVHIHGYRYNEGRATSLTSSQLHCQPRNIVRNAYAFQSDRLSATSGEAGRPRRSTGRKSMLSDEDAVRQMNYALSGDWWSDGQHCSIKPPDVIAFLFTRDEHTRLPSARLNTVSAVQTCTVTVTHYRSNNRKLLIALDSAVIDPITRYWPTVASCAYPPPTVDAPVRRVPVGILP